ncbi:sigma 54-interacting transcriptional regulator [Sedimentibacter sp.]|uniref:sigma-54 interaction domain-containing protein n=1 Tax=Sedimentibacter sp. TaxID=1960295 RepID=UPI00289B3641|nr:sigma 54-interacting transcriptional regulator [Sedimentibacter sp.]
MFSNDSYTKQFTDMMSEGFIFIDSNGTIQIYNSKAKEIFGIDYEYDYSHSSGKIEEGDIVIIGDSYLGRDDGGITPESLKAIGIKDPRIKTGDAIIAVGTYSSCKPNNCRYVFSDNNNSAEKLELDCVYKGVSIYVCIDFINRMVVIQADSERYVVDYIKCIGHIVVLDAVSKKMKFYQAKGYTARNEDIGSLLHGRVFMAKGENSEIFDVIGKNVFEIHKDNSTIQEFYDAAIGNDIIFTNEYKEINGRPTICSLFPVNKDGKRVGAVLKIKDISEIKKVIKERDDALQNYLRIERKLIDEENSKKLLPELIGESSEIMQVKNLAVKASKSKSTVLILGESGTGKNLLARAIHDNSENRNKPFIAVNCSAIPDSLLESELFGYEEGSFTGAKLGGKKGLFETAQGGTLFLDEIAEISPSLQVKLLHVLQDKTFYKIGGNDLIKLNVRIIAATNKNLEEEILKNRFREDLYYRINVFPIWIPPLRERKQDMYALVKDLLPAICSRLGCEEKGISGEALRLLLSYNYPGNVRELENILERAVNLTEGKTIFSKNLSIDKKSDLVKTESNKTEALRGILENAEKEAIEAAISYNRGDKQAAIKDLGIGKTSFYEKIKKYNIDL